MRLTCPSREACSAIAPDAPGKYGRSVRCAAARLPARPFLNRGETLPFRPRLAAPPADAGDVEVRFLNRHDLEAGR